MFKGLFNRSSKKKDRPDTELSSTTPVEEIIRTVVADGLNYYHRDHLEEIRIDICNSVAAAFGRAPMEMFDGRGSGSIRLGSDIVCSYLLLLSAVEKCGTAVIEIEFTNTGDTARFFFYTQDGITVRLVDEKLPYDQSLTQFHRMRLAGKAMVKPEFIKRVVFTLLNKSATEVVTIPPGNVVTLFPPK